MNKRYYRKWSNTIEVGNVHFHSTSLSFTLYGHNVTGPKLCFTINNKCGRLIERSRVGTQSTTWCGGAKCRGQQLLQERAPTPAPGLIAWMEAKVRSYTCSVTSYKGRGHWRWDYTIYRDKLQLNDTFFHRHSELSSLSELSSSSELFVRDASNELCLLTLVLSKPAPTQQWFVTYTKATVGDIPARLTLLYYDHSIKIRSLTSRRRLGWFGIWSQFQNFVWSLGYFVFRLEAVYGYFTPKVLC